MASLAGRFELAFVYRWGAEKERRNGWGRDSAMPRGGGLWRWRPPRSVI